ncbi:MAG: hypothetical protein R3D27_09050 [Hyphomicrobiaceae bacterium]
MAVSPHVSPRYEFRIFMPADADTDSLVPEGSALEVATSSESYIVSRLTIDSNVKLRDGALDVKELKAREGLLELWQPTLVCALPVEARAFTDRAVAGLGLDLDLPAGAVLDIAAIRQICDAQPSVVVVDVEKRRLHFKIGDALAESSTISTGSGMWRTMAVEAEEADAVNQAIEAIGLNTFDNESYPAFLQRIAF